MMYVYTRLLLLLLLHYCSQQHVLVLGQPPPDWMVEAQKANCGDIQEAKVFISNESGTQFDVFWVHPKTQVLTQVTEVAVANRAVATFNSHVNSIMELHEIPDETTGECMSKDDVCRRTYVKTISPNADFENVYRVDENFEAVYVTDTLRARALTGEHIKSTIGFNNQSGNPIDIYWVETGGGNMLKMTQDPLQSGMSLSFDSYVENEFSVHEAGDCAQSSSCRSFNVRNPGNDQTILIGPFLGK